MNRFKTFLLILAACLATSCNEDDEQSSNPLPTETEKEIRVELEIEGAPNQAPANETPVDSDTRSIPDEGDTLFPILTSIAFYKDGATYKYYAVRPVIASKSSGYTISLPGALVGKAIKVHVYANSQNILTDEVYKQFVSGTTTETQVTGLLELTGGRWNCDAVNYAKIPMYGKTMVENFATTTTSLPAVTLRRMMARVDVGLNYDGTTEGSKAEELADKNFKIMEVRVYNTKNKGRLIHNDDVSLPSLPTTVGGEIPMYAIPATDATNKYAVEREVYLFEHDVENNGTHDARRPCILIKGRYYTTPGVESSGQDGYYRLDFHNGTVYQDILRNTLYRFNITKVSGAGYKDPIDALNAVSSNVTVQLEEYTMGQDDVSFDGQYFLSVSKDEMELYLDNEPDMMTVNTNYPTGWKIVITKSIGGSDLNSLVPNESGKGSSNVLFKWPSAITAGRTYLMEFDIVAGNLKKHCKATIYGVNPPPPLQTIDFPRMLYYLHTGGTQDFTVTTNLSLASFSEMPSPEVSLSLGTPTAKSVPVTLARAITASTPANGGKATGYVGVSLTTQGTMVNSYTRAIQYLEELTESARFEKNPIDWDDTSFRTYPTRSDKYDYLWKREAISPMTFATRIIHFHKTVPAITQSDQAVPQNKSYNSREIAKVTIIPSSKVVGAFAVDTDESMAISILGHTNKVITVTQDGKVQPKYILPTSYNLGWNAKTIDFDFQPTADTAPVVTGEVTCKLIINNSSAIMTGGTYDKASGASSLPTKLNRKSTARTESHRVEISGFEDTALAASNFTVTQTGAPALDFSKLEVTCGVAIKTTGFKKIDGVWTSEVFMPKDKAVSGSLVIGKIGESGIYQGDGALDSGVANGLGKRQTNGVHTVHMNNLRVSPTTEQATRMEMGIAGAVGYRVVSDSQYKEGEAVAKAKAWKTFTFKVEPQRNGYSDSERTLAIKVYQNDDEKSGRLNLRVEGNPSMEPTVVLGLVNDVNGQANIEVDAGTTWTASISPAATLSATSGSKGFTNLRVQLPDNTTTTTKDFTLTVRTTDPNFTPVTKTIKMRQYYRKLHVSPRPVYGNVHISVDHGYGNQAMAQKFCSDMNKDGETGWRLPDYIVDGDRFLASLNNNRNAAGWPEGNYGVPMDLIERDYWSSSRGETGLIKDSYRSFSATRTLTSGILAEPGFVNRDILTLYMADGTTKRMSVRCFANRSATPLVEP